MSTARYSTPMRNRMCVMCTHLLRADPFAVADNGTVAAREGLFLNSCPEVRYVLLFQVRSALKRTQHVVHNMHVHLHQHLSRLRVS